MVDPFKVMDIFGADAVRWYLFVNNPPWKATLFNEDDIAKTIISDFFRSLSNTYAFFALYANIDNFTGYEDNITVAERPEIDQWIISRVNTILIDYRREMEAYELTKAHRAIQSFVIYELSNWYIRRNRRRFWKGDKDNDKIAAYQTLKEVLVNVLAMMAPAAPFLSENLYLRLRTDNEPESIHLMELPQSDSNLIKTELERKMGKAQRIVFLARSLREKSKLRTRQPLRRILVPVLSPKDRRDIQYFQEIIKEEINIKEIEFVTGDTDIVSKVAKPNFKVIGKKYGKNTQFVANAIKELDNSKIRALEKTNSLDIIIRDEDVTISLEDVEISSENIEGWLVATDDGITVALDTQLDEELVSEGIAREFVNRIQSLRKKSGFEVTDRISIEFKATDTFKIPIEKKTKYIQTETLAEEIVYNPDLIFGKLNEEEEKFYTIDEERLCIEIKKK